MAIVEAPLLFEAGMDAVADAVICVVAPLAARLRRIRRRDGLTQEDAMRRIRSQNPQETNARLADYILSTDAPIADTRRRAMELWRQVMQDGPRRMPRGLGDGAAPG